MKTQPHYRRLYIQLRRHILEGVYKPGDILPSENELCTINDLTRPTVRQALELLANEGLIKKHQGLGSVVQPRPLGIGILTIKATASAIGSDNLKTEVIVKPRVIRWPEKFAFELSETEKESGCIYFERIRYVFDIPVFYDISYLPNINLPRFTSRNLNNASLFNILTEQYQVEIKGGQQYLKAIPADKVIQKHLKVKPEHAILHLQRKIETNRLEFYIYSFLYCNTSAHSLYGRF